MIKMGRSDVGKIGIGDPVQVKVLPQRKSPLKRTNPQGLQLCTFVHIIKTNDLRMGSRQS